MKSKYFGAAPPQIRKYLKNSVPASVVSARQEIALLDARVNEVLESTRERDPVRVAQEAQEAHRRLRSALRQGELDEAQEASEVLARHLTETAASAANWDEIRRCLDTRDRLARTELGYQKLLSEKILLEHVDQFLQAVMIAVKDLPLERKVLNRFGDMVFNMARNVTRPALEAGTEGEDEE